MSMHAVLSPDTMEEREVTAAAAAASGPHTKRNSLR